MGDRSTHQFYTYDIDQPNSLTLFPNNVGFTIGKDFNVFNDGGMTQLAIATGGDYVLFTPLTNPIPAPTRSIAGGTSEKFLFYENDLITIDSTRSHISRVKTETDSSMITLYSSMNIHDMTLCGESLLCFIDRTTRLGTYNFSNGFVTIRDQDAGGFAKIAYSAARDELIVANLTFGEIYAIKMSEFHIDDTIQYQSGLTGLTAIAVTPNDSSGLVSYAYVQDSGRIVKLFSKVVGTPHDDSTTIIDTQSAWNVSVIKAIETSDGGGSGDSGGNNGTQCSDGIDNDGDSLVDDADPGCVNSQDDDETDQCSEQNSTDSDGDGVIDCADDCPDDASKTEQGVCGCGQSDNDTDGDGVPNCLDNCPSDIEVSNSEICRDQLLKAGVPAEDHCQYSLNPNTNKCELHSCPGYAGGHPVAGCDGCGEVYDGLQCSNQDEDCKNDPDCIDECPNDSSKSEPGICGCGVADVDSDGDGTPDCSDPCPTKGFIPSLIYKGTDKACGCAYPSEAVGVCLTAPPFDPELNLPSASASIVKYNKNSAILSIELPDVGKPEIDALSAKRNRGKRNRKTYIQNKVTINQLNLKTSKTKKVIKTTKKNQLKTAVKRGSIVTVTYEKHLKRKGKKRANGKRKSKTLAKTQEPSRPTVLIVR